MVEGTVTNVVDFGAFIALDNGLEGLLHLSEMGDGALKEPYSYVKKGDRLGLRISHLEPEKRRVGFTQRWGTDAEGGAPPPEGETPVASAETPADDAEPVDAAPVDEVVNEVPPVDEAPVEGDAEETTE